MIKRICDIPSCLEVSFKEDIMVCSGWKLSKEFEFKKEFYKPFEYPTIITKDLCEKHFKMWCKSTYECFYGRVK